MQYVMKIKVSGRLETVKNIVKTVYGGFRCKNRATILVTGINVPPATIFFDNAHQEILTGTSPRLLSEQN